MKNKNRVSVSILLSVLAFSDGCTALSFSITDNLPYISYHEFEGILVQRTRKPDFTECVVYALLSTMKAAFHISVLHTMTLCIQRSTAIFTFCEKQNLFKNKISDNLVNNYCNRFFNSVLLCI